MGKKTELTTCQKGMLWFFVMGVSLILLITGIVLSLQSIKEGNSTNCDKDENVRQDEATASTVPTSTTTVSTTTSPAPKSPFGQYRFAAAGADAEPCSAVGIDIMGRKQGSTVDAAIAATLCIGVVNLHNNGIGGGHFMTIYDTPRNGSEKVFNTIFGRERAPHNATEDMFVNGTASSSVGGKAIAIPGEVKGFHTAWLKFGRLPWHELVEPAIEVCKRGAVVSRDVAFWIQIFEKQIRNDSSLSELLLKEDGSLLAYGDVMKRPKLAITLEQIAEDPTAFYNPDSELAKDIIDDITDYDGIMTLEDLAGYEVYDKDPLMVHLSNGNYTIYGLRPPSGGVIFQYIMNILDGYNFSPDDVKDTESTVLAYHRIAEAFKYAYARRTRLADEDFVNVSQLVANLTSSEYADETRAKIDDNRTYGFEHYNPDFAAIEDHGTSHSNYFGTDGSAVAVTSTINWPFGSLVRGSRTGIIFNNEMDDFSTPGLTNLFGFPPSPNNFIKPGKMPLSSMCPTLVTDDSGKVVYMSGASGGSRITTGTAFVAIHALWFGMRIDEATDAPRMHHQLVPNVLELETGFDEEVRKGLEAKGHVIGDFGAVHVQTIHNKCDGSFEEEVINKEACINAVEDRRKEGTPDGY